MACSECGRCGKCRGCGWCKCVPEVKAPDPPIAVCERRERPRPGFAHFKFFHGGIEHVALWNQTIPKLDTDDWIEVPW